ncbi:MAG TPA: hypothetical protein VHR45_08780 [Thermoanaerobaculia bacterium]|nr:hypothetical protein [Thermoanaerobaculia bacterium]
MSRKIFAFLLLTGFAAAAVLAQTADELVEKNIQAQGGRKRLKSVQTIRLTGRIVRGSNDELPIVTEWAPPGHKMRLDFTADGKTNTRVFDGSNGWEVMPVKGKASPQKVTGAKLKDLQDEADFYGKLSDYKAKGSEVEALGKDELDGTPVYKLKLTKRDGSEITIYLDAGNFLKLKEEETRTERGEVTDWETRYADYKTVEGLTQAFTIKVKSTQVTGGGMVRTEGSLTYSFDKLEVNVDIPASRFEWPKAETKKK